MAKKLTDRAKVRKRYPFSYAYQWGPREWCIYASHQGINAGRDISGTRTSQKAAWLFAAAGLSAATDR
jgi:hypothetical protein